MKHLTPLKAIKPECFEKETDIQMTEEQMASAVDLISQMLMKYIQIEIEEKQKMLDKKQILV